MERVAAKIRNQYMYDVHTAMQKTDESGIGRLWTLKGASDQPGVEERLLCRDH